MVGRRTANATGKTDETTDNGGFYQGELLRYRMVRCGWNGQGANYSFMDWKVDWDLSQRVLGAAFDTHRELGPGLLERVYEECLCWHLRAQSLSFTRQQAIPMKFHGAVFPGAFTLDIVVESRLILEIKSVERIHPIYRSQLITYLKMTGMSSGLLINFNSDPLQDGIVRVVNPK